MSLGLETVLWVLLVISTVTDLLSGKIYNLITFPALALGILVQVWVGGITILPSVLLAIGIAFALFFPLYFFKVLAAGDVKLLMAVAAWSDSSQILKLALVSIFIGGTVGLIILVTKKGVKESVSGMFTSQTRIAFAPAFLCAMMVIKIMEINGWQIF